MKKGLFTIVLSLFCALTFAQSIDEIQNSKDYIWGTGQASTIKKADQEALAALISQISTNVSSKFDQLTESEQQNGDITLNESFKSIISTYSNATLNNTRRIIISNEPEAAVLRYIKVSEIEKIFERRRMRKKGLDV